MSDIKLTYTDEQLAKLQEIEPFDLKIRKYDVICDQCILGYDLVFEYDGTREGFQAEFRAWESRGYRRDPKLQVPGWAHYDE